MAKFDGKWPKRHMLLCNSRPMAESLQWRGGYLSQQERKELPGAPLAVKKNGKYNGNPKLLKESQTLDK